MGESRLESLPGIVQSRLIEIIVNDHVVVGTSKAPARWPVLCLWCSRGAALGRSAGSCVSTTTLSVMRSLLPHTLGRRLHRLNLRVEGHEPEEAEIEHCEEACQHDVCSFCRLKSQIA
jgi:hypothetical protein